TREYPYTLGCFRGTPASMRRGPPGGGQRGGAQGGGQNGGQGGPPGGGNGLPPDGGPPGGRPPPPGVPPPGFGPRRDPGPPPPQYPRCTTGLPLHLDLADTGPTIGRLNAGWGIAGGIDETCNRCSCRCHEPGGVRRLYGPRSTLGQDRGSGAGRKRP